VYTYVVVRASAQTATKEYIVKHRKREERFVNLGTLSTDTASKLDILWHNGDTLGVDGTQVGVLKQSNEVSLTGLLESSNSSRLEPEISFEVLSDFSHETLEGQLPDEKLSRLLVSSDLTESDSSWPVSVGLLDSSGRRS